MKKLICSVCIGGLALATTALGDNKNHGNGESVGVRAKGHSPAATSVAPATSRQVTSARSMQRSISRAPVRQRTYVATPRVRSNATVRSNTTVRNNIASARASRNTNARVRNNVTVNRERNFARNRQVNVGSNFAVNRNRNAVVTNNWRGDRFRGQNYAAFRNYHRQWHNRDWWHHHYSNIIFVSGGWWYWNTGYWYPAWGYAPGAYYPYDGPIYGYSNLAPDQVVVNVQTQLAREGYYGGPVDGVLGPMTRQAIAAFQADHGLAVTSTVDEPTMATLGLS
jgi:hypothetical protein